MKNFFLIILFLVISNYIFSNELEKKEWKVEFGELQGINLSLSNQFLVSTLPSYFISNFQSENGHYLGAEEFNKVESDLRSITELKLKKELSDKILAKDKLDFTKDSEDQMKKILLEIDKIKESISQVKNLNLKKVSKLPIVITPEKSNFKYIDNDKIKYYLNQKNIDYYISGSIEEVSENLILTITLFSKYENNFKVVWTGIGSNEDILNYRSTVLDLLSKDLISDNIVKLKINVTPNDSLIYVNKTFRGLGSFSGYFLNEEKLKIEISKEGYNSYYVDRILSENNNNVEVDLNAIIQNKISVDSEPSEANVYIGSKFYGKTPLEVPISKFSQKLTISLEGYNDKSIILNNKSKDVIIKLDKNIFDKDENYIKKKNSFYNSTAIFSFALAAPLLLNTQGDNIESIVNNISIGNAIFWGINMFYRLYEYLHAAELSVE